MNEIATVGTDPHVLRDGVRVIGRVGRHERRERFVLHVDAETDRRKSAQIGGDAHGNDLTDADENDEDGKELRQRFELHSNERIDFVLSLLLLCIIVMRIRSQES